MIEKNQTINLQNVKGKRIRNHFLNPFVLILYAAPLLFCSLVPELWEAVVILPATCLVLLLFLCVLLLNEIFFGRIECVLSERKLYFFDGILTEICASNKKRESMCSGSIPYEDVLRMAYVPPQPRFRISKAQSHVPQYIILQGVDFQLVLLDCGKNLIRQLEKRQKALGICVATDDIIDFQQLEYQREGTWAEIWDRFKQFKATDIFDKDDCITDLAIPEDDNYIHIRVQRGENEFTFDINETELIMVAEQNNRVSDVPLSQIPDIPTLYAHMQNFIT